MVTLRDYQKNIASQAVAILRQHGMVYLAMEVRTGKTFVSLEVAAQYGAKSVLFLTKKKAIQSIVSDYTAGEYSFELLATNYEQLGKFDPRPFDLIICDESHCLGAYPKASLRTRKLALIVGTNPVIYLSGTPTPEGYSQIYHQLAISKNNPYRNYRNFYAWARDYVNITQVKRGPYMVNDYSDADETRIKSDIAPIMLTYSQEDAGFSCPVAETFHEVEIPIIPHLIKQIFRNKILNFDGGTCVADTPVSLLSKMHQLSGGAVICDTKTVIITDTKARYIADNFNGKRIAIFYKFQAEREILQSVFAHAADVPEEFQQGKSDVFISQILSGREGIALSTADAIVFYNIDYSSTSYWQARARLQDLHRTTPAEVHWIFTKGGIEKRVYKAVVNKLDFTASYFYKNVARELR
jgi:SNF2 family DNA or RNA helicase